MLVFEMGFEYLDVLGDAGISVTGKSLEKVFEYSALGMYGLITDIDKVEIARQVTVEAQGRSRDGLLVAWLNELIFRFDTYGFIGSSVLIKELSRDMVLSTVGGETFDPKRHPGGILLKAATYHGLMLEEFEGGWRAEIIFDI
jgi:SHS2 domain-containing protein